MNEAHPLPEFDSTPADDPSADVAETQAPAHLEERGVNQDLERKLDQAGETKSD